MIIMKRVLKYIRGIRESRRIGYRSIQVDLIERIPTFFFILLLCLVILLCYIKYPAHGVHYIVQF